MKDSSLSRMKINSKGLYSFKTLPEYTLEKTVFLSRSTFERDTDNDFRLQVGKIWIESKMPSQNSMDTTPLTNYSIFYTLHHIRSLVYLTTKCRLRKKLIDLKP